MERKKETNILVKILVVLILIASAVLIFLLFGKKPSIKPVDEGGDTPNEELNIDIEDATKIDLGSQAEAGNITITIGGKYVLVGEAKKPVEINTDDEVVLYMGNAKIEADGSAINNTGSGKITINSLQGSDNSLKTKSAKGVIVSKGDIEIAGRGNIKIFATDKEKTHCIVTEGTIIYNPGTRDWYDCADNIRHDAYTN